MKNKYTYILLCVVLFCCRPSLSYAELSEKHYNMLKIDSSEHIKVKILSVTVEHITNCKKDIKYLAQVITIFRTSSSIQVNDEVVIYSWGIRNKSTCIGGGPGSPGLLNVGWLGDAYLKPKGDKKNMFSIAAHGKSFEEDKK